MNDYFADVQRLEAELAQLEQAFRGLADSDWHRPTLLRPPSETLPRWTIFELAGHVDIAIGVTQMLIASHQDGQVGRDRVSFFIFPRSQVAPVFYDYAYTMVEGKAPGQMADVLAGTFTRTIAGARAASPELVGRFEFDDGDETLMRLGEFVPSRMVEAVVHGLDLTDALGQDPDRHPGRGGGDGRPFRRAARPADCPGPPGRPHRRSGLGPRRVRPRTAPRPAAPPPRINPCDPAGRPCGVASITVISVTGHHAEIGHHRRAASAAGPVGPVRQCPGRCTTSITMPIRASAWRWLVSGETGAITSGSGLALPVWAS